MKTLEPQTRRQRKMQALINNNAELRAMHESRRVTRHWQQFEQLRKRRDEK